MSRTQLLEDPELRAFLPLLLVAWSDGDLEPSDRDALHAHVERMPWLRPAARLALASWLVPSSPPNAEEMAALRDALANVAGTLAPERRADLVSLGLSMAGDRADEDTKRALADLEAELGASSFATAALLRAAPAPTPTRTVTPSSFDVASARRLLDGPEVDIRERARAFLADPERRAYGLPVSDYRAKVTSWLSMLAKEGFGQYAYPGITTDRPDLGAFFATFETLAYGDLSLVVKLGVQFGLFGGSIYFLGTDAQRQKYLPAAARLELAGCFAMSEVGHGSDVQSLETEARWDAERRVFVVVTPSESARKDWIGGAAESARVATVFARLLAHGEDHGVHAFVVPIRDDAGTLKDGVRASDSGHKMGLNGVDNGRLWFDRVEVPEEALLARIAWMNADGRYESAIENPKHRFFTMLGTLVGGRVSVASGALSASKVALTIAIRYATTRRQFGPERGEELPLLAYPTHRRRLLPRLATAYVLSFAVASLQARFVAAQNAGKDGVPAETRDLEAAAAAIKAAASAHAVDTVAECRRACGGQGYLSVNRLPQIMDDVEVFTTFEGDNTVLLQLVAKGLLSGYKKRFDGVGFSTIVRHLMKKAHVVATEKNVIAVRRVDPEHLRDREFHLAAFRYREERLLETAALRLKKRIEKKHDAQATMLEVQEHLVALAWAHADRIALEAFDDALRGAKEAGTVDAATLAHLDTLGALHALTRIRDEAELFLSEGYVEPAKVSAIRKETTSLLDELAANAGAFVEAFGIPDACLAAPIAFMDPAHPRW